jgi:hypothetical protein
MQTPATPSVDRAGLNSFQRDSLNNNNDDDDDDDDEQHFYSAPPSRR